LSLPYKQPKLPAELSVTAFWTFAPRLVHSEQSFGCRHRRREGRVKVDSTSITAVFRSLFTLHSVDQDPPHRFGGSGKEMAAAIPALDFVDVHQPQVLLVNEGGACPGFSFASLAAANLCNSS